MIIAEHVTERCATRLLSLRQDGTAPPCFVSECSSYFRLVGDFFDLFGLNLFISGNTAAVVSSYLPPKRRTGPGHNLFSGPDFRRKFSEIFFRSSKKIVVVVTPVQTITLSSDRGYQGESSFFVC